MPTCVVLCNNIYDEKGEKRLRGEAWDASQEFCDMVLKGDAEAERQPRIAVVEIQKKRGRPPKEKTDADS